MVVKAAPVDGPSPSPEAQWAERTVVQEPASTSTKSGGRKRSDSAPMRTLSLLGRSKSGSAPTTLPVVGILNLVGILNHVEIHLVQTLFGISKSAGGENLMNARECLSSSVGEPDCSRKREATSHYLSWGRWPFIQHSITIRRISAQIKPFSL
jgi:hypothetical protein